MPNEPKREKDPSTDEQERYGQQWSRRERQQREDRERRRDEPDYGGPFGL